jgi:geranylgeranyl diphosphate synthase type I
MDPVQRPSDLNPGPLASPIGLAAVESMMERLARGGRRDKAGEIASESLQSGGKRLRARLALAAGEALGVDRRRLIPWAAACELLHLATLVHDDIQDGDRQRRGRPTAWANHGVGQAINAGDLMLMLPFLAVGEVAATATVRSLLFAAVADAACRTARGQAEEMDLPNRDNVGWEDWLWAAEGKSGALLGLPVHGAAILAGWSGPIALELAYVFGRIGVLYQLQDDLLDLGLGKGKGRRAADLEEGKVNALVAAHLLLHPEERAQTLEFLRSPEIRRQPEAVEAMVSRLFAGGAVAFVNRSLEGSVAGVREGAIAAGAPGLAILADELIATVQASARAPSAKPKEN